MSQGAFVFLAPGATSRDMINGDESPVAKILSNVKSCSKLISALQESPAQDKTVQIFKRVIDSSGATQQEAAKEMADALKVLLPAHLLSLARTPRALLDQAPHLRARLLDYLSLATRACDALLASGAPGPTLCVIRASLLRLAWGIARGSPAKRAEILEPVLGWASSFLASHLHPHASDSQAQEVASVLAAALVAELQRMAAELQVVVEGVTPVAGDSPASWPSPPKARPPAALPNAVAFSQAVLDYQRIGQLMDALKSRPHVSVLGPPVAVSALALLRVVESLGVHASRLITLVHALAAVPPSNEHILPACLLDMKPLLRVIGTCHTLIKASCLRATGCGVPPQLQEPQQQPEELDRLGVLEVGSVCALVRERCSSSGVQPLGFQHDRSPSCNTSVADSVASSSKEGGARSGCGGAAAGSGGTSSSGGCEGGGSPGVATGLGRRLASMTWWSGRGGGTVNGRGGRAGTAGFQGSSSRGRGRGGNACPHASVAAASAQAVPHVGASAASGPGGEEQQGCSSAASDHSTAPAAAAARHAAASRAGQAAEVRMHVATGKRTQQGPGRGGGWVASTEGVEGGHQDSSGGGGGGDGDGGSKQACEEQSAAGGAGGGDPREDILHGVGDPGDRALDAGVPAAHAISLADLHGLMERLLRLPLFASQIKAEDLIGRFPVLPCCLSLRAHLPQATRAAVVQALMPEKKKQGCLDHHATITLRVDRTNLLATSLHQLQRHEPHMLALRPIAIKLKGEEGTGSGVTRDWLTQLSRELVDPNYGIFVHLGPDLRTIHPSPAAKLVHGEDLPKIMHTAGVVLGLAVALRVPVGVRLSSAALDLALGRSLTLTHLEELDKELAASCHAVLSAPPESVESMGLTFVASDHSLESNHKPEVALVPGGDSRAVTAANREEYVRLLAAFCCGRGSTQVAATELVKGFLSVSPCFHQRFHKNPVEMLAGVGAGDLALLLRGSEAGGGSPSTSAAALNVAEWRQATGSHGFGTREEEYMDTFFDVVEHELTAKEQQSLLLFWTGLANLPLGGFSNLPSRPQLWCANEGADEGASGEQLPQAHTCFMQLTLPRYRSRMDLITALKTALKHAERFDMA